MLKFSHAKLAILIIIIITISVGATIRQYNLYGFRSSQFRINQDIQNVNNYPFLKWTDITNGNLSEFLRQEKKKGNIDILLTDTKLIEEYYFTNDELFEQKGLNYPIPKLGKEVSVDRTIPQSYPFHIVAIFETSLYGDKYTLLIQELKNMDGSEVFIPLITNKETLFSTNDEGHRYVDFIFDPSLNNFASPVLAYQSDTSCNNRYPNFEKYCNWYKTQKKLKINSSNLVKSIQESSTFTEEIEEIPSMIKLVLIQ